MTDSVLMSCVISCDVSHRYCGPASECLNLGPDPGRDRQQQSVGMIIKLRRTWESSAVVYLVFSRLFKYNCNCSPNKSSASCRVEGSCFYTVNQSRFRPCGLELCIVDRLESSERVRQHKGERP